MAVLEIHTFALMHEISALDFRALDERMQEWCYVHRAGIARRTTARTDDGHCVVVTLFATPHQADETYLSSNDEIVHEWKAAINWGSSTSTMYSLL